MIQIDKDTCKEFWNNEANKIGSDVDRHFQSGMVDSDLFLTSFRKNIEEYNFNLLIDMDNINTVLELGCGSGRWSAYLSDKSISITAVDFSESMIKLAKKYQKSIKSSGNINFIQCAAQDFFDNQKYDLIYLSGVSSYLTDDDMKSMMKNVRKMSHKKTILLARDSISILNDTFHKNGEYPVIYRKLSEYNRLFETEGFFMQKKMRSFFKPYLSIRFKLDKILDMSSVMFLEKFIGQRIARYKEYIDIKIRNREKKINHIFHLYEIE